MSLVAYGRYRGLDIGAPTPVSLALPTARACISRRDFAIRLRAPRGQRLRSARVYVNGREVKVLRGRRLRARVDLRGLPVGTVTVRAVARTTHGHVIRDVRVYHTCRAKPPRRRRRPAAKRGR